MIKSALTGVRIFDFYGRYKGLHNVLFICFYTEFEEHPNFDNIKHFHISDHSLASDCLLPYGGGFDFARFFKHLSDLGYNGAALIEVYSSAYHDYSEIYDSYHRLLSDFERVN